MLYKLLGDCYSFFVPDICIGGDTMLLLQYVDGLQEVADVTGKPA